MPSELADMLDIILPNGGYVFSMMSAFFDESGTHHNSPIMCMAGYLIDSGQVGRFQQDWRSTLDSFGIEHFHMSDCAHGLGEFKNLTKDDRAFIARRLISLINLRVDIGIAVSVNEEQFNAMCASIGCTLGAYTMCAVQCVTAVGTLMHNFEMPGDVAYVFESGHRHAQELNRIMQAFADDQSAGGCLRYASHTFLKKQQKSCGLDAADLLAWEWMREQHNRYGEKRRPRRRSLEALLCKSHVGYHLDQSKISEFLVAGIHAAQEKPLPQLSENFRRFDDISRFRNAIETKMIERTIPD